MTLTACGNDFLANAVSGDDGDAFLGMRLRVHGRKLTQAERNE